MPHTRVERVTSPCTCDTSGARIPLRQCGLDGALVVDDYGLLSIGGVPKSTLTVLLATPRLAALTSTIKQRILSSSPTYHCQEPITPIASMTLSRSIIALNATTSTNANRVTVSTPLDRSPIQMDPQRPDDPPPAPLPPAVLPRPGYSSPDPEGAHHATCDLNTLGTSARCSGPTLWSLPVAHT